MNTITRKVYCACTGNHTFRYERALFAGMAPAMVNHRIICTKCGAYVIRSIPSSTDDETIHQGPDSRMYQYWRDQKE